MVKLDYAEDYYCDVAPSPKHNKNGLEESSNLYFERLAKWQHPRQRLRDTTWSGIVFLNHVNWKQRHERPQSLRTFL